MFVSMGMHGKILYTKKGFILISELLIVQRIVKGRKRIMLKAQISISIS